MAKVEIIPFSQSPGGSTLPEDFFTKSDEQLSSTEPWRRERLGVAQSRTVPQ